MRTPNDSLRSMKRYVALALGPDWEVRLSSEKGTFNRPYARVALVPSMEFSTVRLPQTQIIASFTITALPVPGVTADESQVEAMRVADLLWSAFSGPGVQGVGKPAMRVPLDSNRPYTNRVPLYDYTGVPLTGASAAVDETARSPNDFLRVVSPPNVVPMPDPASELLWAIAANIRMSWLRSAAVPSTASTTTSVTSGAQFNG